MPQVLLVEDDPATAEWIIQLVRGEGCTIACADSLRAARIQLTRSTPDLLLASMNLPDGPGCALLEDLEPGNSTDVVVLTGAAGVEAAVEALRVGAVDYLVKPIPAERLRGIVQRVPRPEQFRREVVELRGELRRLGRFGHILGSSPVMHRLYDQLARVAPTSATVLLVGESGVGKELAAQTLHDLSRRKQQPFLPLNCGAISPQLIESELFGHEKGSFTGADRQHHGFFERAHRGTLFLDEITEMRPELQVKLLRVLETGAFMRVGTNEPVATDVRLLAATNRSPEKAVAEGQLRADLYHRLNVFPIQIPPLRERGTDIELLAQHFLDQFNAEEGTRKRFSPASIAALYTHPWPGNVRELKNYVQRVFIMADDIIDVGPRPDPAPASTSSSLLTVRIGSTLEEMNRRLIEATLQECGNVKRRAAEMLGISLKTLYNKLAIYQGGKSGEDEIELEGDFPLPPETGHLTPPASRLPESTPPS